MTTWPLVKKEKKTSKVQQFMPKHPPPLLLPPFPPRMRKGMEFEKNRSRTDWMPAELWLGGGAAAAAAAAGAVIGGVVVVMRMRERTSSEESTALGW